VAPLAWPVTSDNYFRIFCYLQRKRVELFMLPYFTFPFLMKTIVSSVRFIVAIIRRSLFCILLVTSAWFHIIIIGFRPILNDNLHHQEIGLKLQEYFRNPVHCLGLSHQTRPPETKNALITRRVSYVS
jgi:hypothetical protein